MQSIPTGYEYDIFISYRQNDNQDGWVTRFVESLEKEIKSIFKEEVSIYFDSDPQHGLHETHDVDASLKEKIKCLVFITIISQTYCDPKSFAWQKEFLPFLEFSKSDAFGLDIKVSGSNVIKRVLPIRIHNIDDADKRLFENEIGGVMRPVDFIYKESGVNRPLHRDDKEETNLNKTNYRNQINKVANAVKEIVNGIAHANDIKAKETPHKVIRPPKKVKRKQVVTIVISLMIAMALLFSYFTYKATRSAPGNIVDKSIAVLPFVNMSKDENNQYFSDGMQEAVLSHLSKIGDLRVISRSSMEQYRESTKSIPEIAEEVSVNYVLEGSVQRSNDKVRITVQLIQAQNDKHIWSQEYDRELKDVFDIQSEIAEEVASHLDAIINPSTKASIEAIPTKNMEAYEFYLRGLDIQQEAKNNEDIMKARYYFQKAIDAQPDFAMAYLGVANTYYQLMSDLNNYKESMDTILLIINKAISLDPKLSEGYLFKGWYYYKGVFNREKAISNFEKATELKPSDPWAYRNLAELYSASAPLDFAKSFYNASKALSVVKGEDLHWILDKIGYIYLSLGDYEKADSIYDEAADNTPSWQGNSARWWLNVLQGNYQKALEYSKKNYELYPDSRKSILELARTYTYLGDFDQAIKYFDLWHKAKDPNSLDMVQYYAFNNEYYYVLLKTGKEEMAKKEISEQIKETKINYKLTGNAEGGYFFDLVQLHCMLGERDSTLFYLRKMEENGFPWGSISFLASNPLTSNFNKDPEYQKIIERGWQTKFAQMDDIKRQEINMELRNSLSK